MALMDGITTIKVTEVKNISYRALLKRVEQAQVTVPGASGYPNTIQSPGWRSGKFSVAPLAWQPGVYRIYTRSGLIAGCGTDALRSLTRALRLLLVTECLLDTIVNDDGSLKYEHGFDYTPYREQMLAAVESLS